MAAVKADVVSSAKDALPLWLQALPDPFDAGEARDAADRALADARAVVLNVKLRFQGTIPPAPWPMSPELQKSIEAMGIARDFFDVLVNHPTTPPAKWHHVDAQIKTGPTFVGLGRQLYGQLADLESKASESTTVDDLIKLIPRPSQLLGSLPTMLMLGLGVLAFAKWKEIERAFAA